MGRTKWTNQYKRSRNHYPPSGDLLDNGQKARIAILAKEAFARINPSSNESDDWRRNQQFLAIGKESLRDATQADYLKLKAHFENLAGETGRAVKSHMADAVKDTAIAMLKLREACEERDLRLEYPEAICRRQYKRGLDEASAGQLWQLVFTVRNRRKPVKREMECPF